MESQALRHRVVWKVGTNVSDEPPALIYPEDGDSSSLRNVDNGNTDTHCQNRESMKSDRLNCFQVRVRTRGTDLCPESKQII
jgi:hypothetical protein